MSTEFPAWAKVGEKVLSVSYRFGDSTPTEGTIKRLTKTRIVVDFVSYEGQYTQGKYDTSVWEEFGRSGDRWQSAAKLIHADSANAKQLYAAQAKRLILNNAKQACGDFQRNRTVEQANLTIKSLQTFIESVGGES